MVLTVVADQTSRSPVLVHEGVFIARVDVDPPFFQSFLEQELVVEGSAAPHEPRAETVFGYDVGVLVPSPVSGAEVCSGVEAGEGVAAASVGVEPSAAATPDRTSPAADSAPPTMVCSA